MSAVTLRKRLVLIIVAVCVLFTALFGRLFYLQIISGAQLQAKAAEQWYRDLPLAAARGGIYDTNGKVLADSKDVFSVYVRPNAVTDKSAVISALSSVLNLDVEFVTKKLATLVSEVTIKRQVEPSAAYALRDMQLDGVYFTLDSKRNYPYGSALSQILGFTNIDNEGQSGIEGYYNKYLKGVNGFAYTETDIKGKELESRAARYVPAIAGCDITLTIDIDIQSFAETAVMSAAAQFSALSASMIVMESDTGAILGMAQTPSFDLNAPPRDNIDLLNSLSKNTMIVDVFEPGSTFKIFTTAAAIEAGAVSSKDRFFCAGNRVVDGQRIRCWRSRGHGSQDLHEGVKNSCNCVFMDLAQRLGTEKFYSYLDRFGIGKKTGVDFYGESAGIIMDKKTVKTVDLARIGFGQAIAVTPLQLITGVSAVVNGGKLYEPYFLKEVKDCNGSSIYSRVAKLKDTVLSESTSSQMRDILLNVVENGGGNKAKVAGFSIGGKTGTAQKYKNGIIAQGSYVSSFIGFAPADNPKYTVLMIVNEPQGYMYYGSLVAAPFAGDVFEKIFNLKGMLPEPQAGRKTVSMPNLIGLRTEEAIKLLKAAGLYAETVGDGDNVTSQLPLPTTEVYEKDVVLVRSG